MKTTTVRSVGSMTAALFAAWTLAGSAQAQVKVGEEEPYSASLASAEPTGTSGPFTVYREIVYLAGATFIRVHFSEFDLAEGESLTVSDPEGLHQHTYSGRGPRDSGEFWSFSIDGERAIVTVYSLGGGASRYEIDRVARGFDSADMIPEQVCGSDGRRDIACYSQGPRRSLPVARLLYQDGGSFLCTGWLVRGRLSSTMMTNNHCIDSQAVLNTLEARFNYRYTNCGGAIDAPFFVFGGGTFLQTSVALDYSLMTLAGDPEGAGAGEFVPTSQVTAVNDRFVLPQHPGGRRKEVGVFEDAAQTVACRIDTVHASVGGYQAGSQMLYECDTEGGSSGSPVLRLPDLRAIAIHHIALGGLPCRNGATHMDNICTNAGADLLCE